MLPDEAQCEILLNMMGQDYDLCEGSFYHFLKAAWPVLEPGQPFVDNWHLARMADHLQAMEEGDLTRLLINVPFRTTKSTACSVAYPVWRWIKNPSHKFLTGSHKEQLATRDALASRRLMESTWFRSRWGDRITFTDDQNQKTRYENNARGWRIVFGMTSGVQGEGGDTLGIDDPHNAKRAMYDGTERQSVIDSYDQELCTRLNDPQKSSIYIVMQRLHKKDLSGHVLEQGGFTHLMLPMSFEEDRKCYTHVRPSNWRGRAPANGAYPQDPRTKAGELLCEQRFTADTVAALTKILGPYGTAGQLQQDPRAREGGLFQRQWFQIKPKGSVPAGAKSVRRWDMAATEARKAADPDYTAGCKMSLKDGVYYIEDMRHGRLSPQNAELLVKQTAELDGRAVKVRMEQEPGSAGKTVIDHYARNVLLGYDFKGIPSTGAKEVRWGPFSTAAEAGNVVLIEGPWNNTFLDEVELAPLGAHDDQLDSAVGAMEDLVGPGIQVF